MKHWAVGLLVLVTFLIQSVVMPSFAVSGIKPNLLLVLAVALAVTYGPYAGLFVGALGGGLQDIVFGRYIGLFTLAGALAGFLVGLVERRVFKEHLFMQVSLTFGAAALNNLVIFAFLKAFGVGLPIFASLWRVVLGEAVYDALLAPAMFALVGRLALTHEEEDAEA